MDSSQRLPLPFMDDDGAAPPAARRARAAPPPRPPRSGHPHRHFLIASGIALVVVAALALWATWKLPLDRALAPLPEPTLVLLDADGEPFARRGAYKEAPVRIDELPPHLVQAILAIEDRRFYRHGGIDPQGIARAAWHDLRAGGFEQGGSTITQQLAKTAFLGPERSLRRKVQEAAIAGWLELRLSKDQILARYLSSVYYGDGVYGMRAAARHYFDKTPQELDIAESAMLAGLVKAPSKLAPTHDLAAAQARARVVLAAMVETGDLTQAQADAIEPATLAPGRSDLPVGTYFADWVSPQARDAFGADYGEIAVRTTLEPRLQALAERLVERTLARNEGADVGQAALVAMRPTGEVVALVGGRDYAASAFDRATQAKRQPGSAFKLFVYLAALRAGYTPETLVEDAPVDLGGWMPANHDGNYAGMIPLRRAFAESRNAAAVRLAADVGPDEVVQAARDLGVRSELGRDASLALGAYETTLIELTAAYAAIAAGRGPIEPFGLADRVPRGELRMLPDDQVDGMRSLLAAVTEGGTGRAADLLLPTYGKTGTTQDHRDAWFVGWSGDLVVGVWMGNDDNTPMNAVSGGGLPALLWRDFMLEAVPGQGPPRRAAPVQRSERRGFWRRVFGWGGRGEGRGNGKDKGKKKGR